MIGQTLSHYRIVDRLGSGGMGVVYRATDTRLGRDVAVKVLPTEFSQDHNALDRFRREAPTASSLDHPNICVVHDVGEHDGQPFIVMQLLHGQTLKDRLAGRRLKVLDVIEYCIQIADALVTAHARGILHRDIKPTNIFITERNDPMLLDFGLAKLMSERRRERPVAAATTIESSTTAIAGDAVTEAGSRVGTAAYMSPEQALGEELDGRSDIFSFGVTIYEMLTEALPFNGSTWAAVFNEIINKTPVAASTANSEIPPDLDRLIAKALEKDRSLRYQTVSDLAADLKRVRRALQSPGKDIRPAPVANHHSSTGRSTTLKADVASTRPILPTEAINTVSLTLDKAPVPEIIEMIVNEDRKVVTAVQREKMKIAQGIDLITQALRGGGRLILVGAGTSGLLGVLEAIEMPRTFGTAPRVVQAIMAGGKEAIFDSKGAGDAEDSYEEGALSIARLQLSKKDVVIGVSASGTTPFVRGALMRTRKTGAKMILITCWPGSELQTFVDLIIAPAVGPEIVAGSTRLKAGTATKMVLNMLTTVSMVRLGKTYGNLMVDVETSSEKLKDRARRIFSIVTGLNHDQSGELLRRAHWNVKAAIVMQKTGLNYAQSLERLKKADGSIREATGEDLERRLRELLQVDRVSR